MSQPLNKLLEVCYQHLTEYDRNNESLLIDQVNMINNAIPIIKNEIQKLNK